MSFESMAGTVRASKSPKDWQAGSHGWSTAQPMDRGPGTMSRPEAGDGPPPPPSGRNRLRFSIPRVPLCSTRGYLPSALRAICSNGFRQTIIVAAKEFSDRFRSGWVIACVLVWLGAIGLTSFLGLIQVGRIGVQGYERTVLSLLNLVQYLVPLLGLLLGHDLMVSENEERTSRLILAGGVSRARMLLGKLIGGILTLAVPLVLGFFIAGAAIGFAARDNAVSPFLRLAVSGLILGVLFLGTGLAISTFSRTRVQALVAALLMWCCVVFVFDLVALGVTLSSRAPAAAQEIDLLCDTTHVNSAADVHAAYEGGDESLKSDSIGKTASLGWLAVNPLDLFRAVNLPAQLGVRVPLLTILSTVILWLALPFVLGLWKFHRTDL